MEFLQNLAGSYPMRVASTAAPAFPEAGTGNGGNASQLAGSRGGGSRVEQALPEGVSTSGGALDARAGGVGGGGDGGASGGDGGGAKLAADLATHRVRVAHVLGQLPAIDSRYVLPGVFVMRGGACSNFMHSRSHMTIDLCIPTMLNCSSAGFHDHADMTCTKREVP